MIAKKTATPKSPGKAKVAGIIHGKAVAKRSVRSSVKIPSKPSAAAAKAAPKNAPRATTKRSARTPARNASKRTQKTVYKQQQPEPERIRDIQQALVDHGYPLEVNGAWDASTVEALKKFQTTQQIDNLSGKGKLDSMTLIALGLGPKREPTSGLSEEPRQTPEGKLP